ncbi:MAG: hypothetical protein ACOC44_11135 [Promethearchaeia archaeon]
MTHNCNKCGRPIERGNFCIYCLSQRQENRIKSLRNRLLRELRGLREIIRGNSPSRPPSLSEKDDRDKITKDWAANRLHHLLVDSDDCDTFICPTIITDKLREKINEMDDKQSINDFIKALQRFIENYGEDGDKT